MGYKDKLIEDVKKLYSDNDIVNQSYFENIIKEILFKSPNDDLIQGVSVKWYKRSQSIELFWDFIDS